jgi:hypothetical protein
MKIPYYQQCGQDIYDILDMYYPAADKDSRQQAWEAIGNLIDRVVEDLINLNK